jgi:histidyl-tRNA synthetase
MIHLADSVLRGAGLDGFRLRVGHVGVLKSVIDWCGLAGTGSGGEGDGGARAGGVMSLIDKGDLAGLEEALEGLGLPADDRKAQTLMAVVEGRGKADDVLARVGPLLGDVPGAAEGLERLREVADLVAAFGVKDFELDLAIARGLDYYTGVVFECDVEALGAEKQVLGGGRYELSHLFDMRDTPMTGFALGFDRLLMALELEGRSGEPARPDVYVVPFTREDVQKAQELVARLRNAGFGAEGDPAGRQMKKALAHASSRDPRFIVFCGGEEGGRGNVVLKDATAREQSEVPLAELDGILRQRLSQKL